LVVECEAGKTSGRRDEGEGWEEEARCWSSEEEEGLREMKRLKERSWSFIF